MTPNPRDVAEFFAQVQRRLRVGAAEYRDRPADARPPDELADEIEQELLDVCAWGLLLWCRVRALRARLPHDRPGG